jgi:RNA polymerase sigma-70 factor (ECF subfamily)
MSEALALPQIIERAQQQDHEAFETIYQLHQRRVYSLCLRMLKNVEQAEDLTQEAFIQVFRRISTYRGESSFTTWLHRVTVNVVLMSLRRKTLAMTSLEALTNPSDDTSAFEFGFADNRLTGALDRLGLERAIEQLPPGYKIIFILHDIEGYEHNEVADLLGCSIGNSKSQLHKARMRLRQLLLRNTSFAPLEAASSSQY